MTAAFPFYWHYRRMGPDTAVLVRGRRCDQNYEDEMGRTKPAAKPAAKPPRPMKTSKRCKAKNKKVDIDALIQPLFGDELCNVKRKNVDIDY